MRQACFPYVTLVMTKRISSAEESLRDRISLALASLGYPNGGNNIDEIESLAWSSILLSDISKKQDMLWISRHVSRIAKGVM